MPVTLVIPQTHILIAIAYVPVCQDTDASKPGTIDNYHPHTYPSNTSGKTHYIFNFDATYLSVP